MSLIVRQFPCLDDNYGYLLHDEASGATAALDPPEGEPVIAALANETWSLSHIINTHWHRDHIGGNEALSAAFGARVWAPTEVAKRTQVDVLIGEGDTVILGESVLRVLHTGGHTLEHVSFYDEVGGQVFVGDTLFALGCGRVFEGAHAQMWTSLARLAALPEQTLVYCAHEYTEANARFALSVDGDAALIKRAEAVFNDRRHSRPTVPTTIGLEKATNPFLRAPILHPDLAPEEAFAALRQAKDNFRS